MDELPNLAQDDDGNEINNVEQFWLNVGANWYPSMEEDQNIRIQYYNRCWWQRFRSLIYLILTNPLDAPMIIFIVLISGVGRTLLSLFTIGLFIYDYYSSNIWIGSLCAICLVRFLHSVVPWLFNLIDYDFIIIAFTILFLTIGSWDISINAHLLRRRERILCTLIQYLIFILGFKFVLLLVRFYFYRIPAYVTAAFVSYPSSTD